MSEPPYWFRRKTLGWGWEPSSREGWIVTGLFFLVDGIGSVLMALLVLNPGLIVTWAIGWIIVFCVIAVTHAEPLR